MVYIWCPTHGRHQIQPLNYLINVRIACSTIFCLQRKMTFLTVSVLVVTFLVLSFGTFVTLEYCFKIIDRFFVCTFFGKRILGLLFTIIFRFS